MATSPPGPMHTNLPNPKKRPSMSSQPSTSGRGDKRPKIHPLRQTSFPATQSAISSARSETGSVTNSLVSATSTKIPGRGRGRPRKSAQIADADVRSATAATDAASQVDGDGRAKSRAKSVVSAKSGANEQEEDDEGDIDGMLENMDEQERRQAEEEETRQEQRRERLAETLDPDQYSRYNAWRALSLNTSTVKRLVNSIVSQSVTSAPLQAIKIYGKWFVGEIVERARSVQSEWAVAYDETRRLEKEERQRELQRLEEVRKAGNLTEFELRANAAAIDKLKRQVEEYIPNPHRAGLLPDHLREALRRYKVDGEGGGVGFQGMSHGLLGVQGSASWRVGDGATGKRLFR